jgi:penicillin amidase
MMAENIQDLRAGFSKIASIHLSFVYADFKGNIGIQAVGSVPIRATVGNYPVNGWDSKTQWSGFIPFEEMPYSNNPIKGYLVNCNNIYTAEGYKWYNSFGKEFKNGRVNRVVEILDDAIKRKKLLTQQDMIDMQSDVQD